ncbi:hypothetical protein G9X43_07955 [Cronobacter turicensis]|uniref:hypothetical protein n=1 Tax=Cronobacter turicensis TaxID=413502 RepID=UPI001411D6BB|nr:hypothetical protein [Cronobacter turicensis]NHV08282.1 hypothetical protein [Cronobacter turicensis]NHV62832.1 hypothetical protein [Cronobacter turicensis]NHW09773.1 hypothetical protein [Cronobacter turicensis]
MKYSPGPWKWEGKVLCNEKNIVGGGDWDFSAANKRLIAAAPELLEALQGYMSAVSEMNEAMKDGYNVQGAISALVGWEDMARAAISKTVGEE